ncbi:hypothetical protein KFK09_024870 [Dendrobium nobile]|uniref:Integrase catalytic domain-containing protein n=1 Tax=Dendrobium nobile TaxID=94219 RepID=A0A8T3AEC2_DENNO|nr:hypothetical protein KFK09_024870 [Dendrobium nobile]
MASSTTSQPGNDQEATTSAHPVLSSSLKFILSNLKNIVQNPLSPDNYPLWKSQILKICHANNFESYLDPNYPIPDKILVSATGSTSSNPLYLQWLLNDQNLAAAICSTISASILPYVIDLESSSAIWTVLQTRFQATNRSKVIQLKNELSHTSLKNSSMLQYLNEIKSLVDQIAAAGSKIDPEDVIHHILNGLPPAYQSFKTTIRTMTQSLNLDQLYSLLISEEIHIASDAARFANPTIPDTALFSSRGRSRRGRGRSSGSRNVSTQPLVTCQICLKRGHLASDCWHRLNAQYVPKPSPKALAADSNSASNDCWYLDSGASSHMTKSLENLSISNPYQGSDSITIGDGSNVSIAHSGKGLLPTPSRKLTLSHILHTPALQYNLLSISQLTRDNNISIMFEPNGFILKDLTTQQILLKGPCKNGLYPICIPEAESPHSALYTSKRSPSIWHARLGHPNQQLFNRIAGCNPELRINKTNVTCHSCHMNKGHKLSFEHSTNREQSALALIHSDLWGPAPILSNSGFLYYVIFIDDYSRYTWIFPLRNKNEITAVFIQFKLFIERALSSKIKKFQSDGGGEYVNTQLTHFLRTNGIQHRIACPCTPEQNGVSERKHRHIVETARTLLHTASLPLNYWPDAMVTSVHLINKLPNSAINHKSPHEMLFHTRPDYTMLRTFGCACFPLTPPPQRHKLLPKAQPCVFLGYSDTYKGYKCLNP